MKPRSLTLLVLILLAVVPLTWQGQLHSQEKPVREPDVIYQRVLAAMASQLGLAEASQEVANRPS